MSGGENDAQSRFPVAIALGSNLGDRREHLAYGVRAISQHLSNPRASAFIETVAVDVAPDHPRYLNGAVVGTTTLSPRELLDRLMAIEKERGRQRPFPMAPRTLDLDLILYGSLVIDGPGLTVPHPRFRARRFVLAPLAEIAPEWRDPISGLTVAELLRGLKA
ncbi:MAG TPA: 2-amino-4-hydroxy-6-hydroxymethyldihydropteridine diphosphokinase [Vicinamibacterales bacterium]|jgi:2-amino-4-hydroxy-6-hydroxymethyldihydropteridine diphosphokinase|nr:2-amino-4-hydroxy-6-hydroxymethyldihydropteridine diphosphokinase [Vicinamibacterales bacterium]